MIKSKFLGPNDQAAQNDAVAAVAAKATTQIQALGAEEPVHTVADESGCVTRQFESSASNDIDDQATLGNANHQIASSSDNVLTQKSASTRVETVAKALQAKRNKATYELLNQLRGQLDFWGLKEYVIAFLVYQYLSAVIEFKINGFERKVEPEFDYFSFSFPAGYSANEHFSWYVPQIGYCLEPELLFNNVLKELRSYEHSYKLPDLIQSAFDQLVSSSEFCNTGWSSVLSSIFEDVDLHSTKLGRNPNERAQRLVKLMHGLHQLDYTLDLGQFSDTLEFLYQMFASLSGKSGGDFQTPPAVSELVAKLATHNASTVTGVYDPCCGTGGLLCKTAELINTEDLILYGQEINLNNYRSALANLTLRGLSPKQFDLYLGDTLYEPAPQHLDKKFSVVVSHPPYSLRVDPEKQKMLGYDLRFMGLPITKSADALFVLHCLSLLESGGTCAIVVPDGLLARPVEAKFRNYLVSSNFVKAVVSLPANIFYGTGTKCSILVLKRDSTSDKIQFIDASSFVERTATWSKGNRRVSMLSDEGIEKVMAAYAKAEEIPGFSKLTSLSEVSANRSNLSVNYYVAEVPEEAEAEKAQLDLDLALKTFSNFETSTKVHSKKFQAVLNSLLNKLSFKDDLTESVESRLERWKLKPEDVAKDLGVDPENLAEVQHAVQNYHPDKPLEVSDNLLIQTSKVVQYIYGSVRLTVQQAAEKIPTHTVPAENLDDGDVAYFAGGIKPVKYVSFDNPHLGESVLVTRYGNAGAVTYYDGPKVVRSSYAFVGRDNLVLTKYLYHALKNIEQALGRGAVGTTIRSLQTKFIMEQTVLIPSLEKQAEIVAQLGHAEELSNSLEAGLQQVTRLAGELRNHLISALNFTNS